ncbi:uncharacterized protein LOC133298513 [Gastrolobium bilobum]|uniref:uncharacterized protein LOC133298513 n=1 Tax=Gastrolobium bilobum TaxID=150636 RepID=UPI002AAFF88E|nr:uncharacterized protein LOC133298513 [Gastrolobium bilobum]
MACPYGNHQEQQQTTHVVSSDWTLEEQAVFQEGLIQHKLPLHSVPIFYYGFIVIILFFLLASVPFTTRYAAIAKQLPNKDVRKVAQQVKLMNEKERGKRRKDGHILKRERKDKKEKVSHPAAKSSAFAARPNVSPYAPMIVMDNDDGISSKAIGGPTGELLEQNAQALKQISANINAASKYQDSIKLFCQTRDNIDKILNNFNDMSEVMKKMPPLPVEIDEKLFSHLQPSSNKSTDAITMFAYSSRSR